MAEVQINISQTTEIPPKLKPGELAYSYKSNKLFIGPKGRYTDPPSENVIEILSLDRYISQDVEEGILDYSPSSDAIYKAIQNVSNNISIKDNQNFAAQNIKKIEFDTTNFFNLNIDQIDPTKINISANPIWKNIEISQNLEDDLNNIFINNNNNNLKFKNGNGILLNVYNNDYIKINVNIDDSDNTSNNKLWSSEKIKNEIQNSIGISLDTDNDFIGINTVPNVDILNANPNSIQIPNTGNVKSYVAQIATEIINGLSLIKYVFTTPSKLWLVNHNKNTTLFQKTILDIDNNEMIAPIEIIDENNFIVELTEELTGAVLLRF